MDSERRKSHAVWISQAKVSVLLEISSNDIADEAHSWILSTQLWTHSYTEIRESKSISRGGIDSRYVRFLTQNLYSSGWWSSLVSRCSFPQAVHPPLSLTRNIWGCNYMRIYFDRTDAIPIAIISRWIVIPGHDKRGRDASRRVLYDKRVQNAQCLLSPSPPPCHAPSPTNMISVDCFWACE